MRLIGRLVGKELRLGPRSPVFFMVIGIPFLITFLVAGVFGSLIDQTPRLGVTDLGDSAVAAELAAAGGIEVSAIGDPERLEEMVEAHDLDAGLLLPAGFDEAAAMGGGTGAVLYVAGSSLASTRVTLSSVVTEVIGRVAGGGPDLAVEVTRLGSEDGVPIGDRLVPLMVFYAVVMAGLYYPAASLVEERERRTIDALLVSPVRMRDILVAKGAVATVLAVAMAMVTLALNRAFGGQALLLAVILTVGGVMLSEAGLLLGLWARDANTMFTAIKGGGIVVFLPVVFTIWPDLPQWIPRFIPTYYFLMPVYEVGVLGAGAGDVWIDVVVGAAFCAALLPLVSGYARRVERRLAAAV